jgi:hypothetical protein
VSGVRIQSPATPIRIIALSPLEERAASGGVLASPSADGDG